MPRDPCKKMEPQGASTKEACGGREGTGEAGQAGPCSVGAGGQGPRCPQRALGEASSLFLSRNLEKEPFLPRASFSPRA